MLQKNGLPDSFFCISSPLFSWLEIVLAPLPISFSKKDASFQSQLFFRETSKLFFHGILAVKVMELQKQRVILSYFPRLLLVGWTLFSIFTK